MTKQKATPQAKAHALCDAAAVVINELPLEQRAGWVIWILEALDSDPSRVYAWTIKQERAAKVRMLEAVRASIEVRLDSGRW